MMKEEAVPSGWVALAHDVEAGAVAKIADAFSDLDEGQTARVAAWVKARYGSVNLVDVGIRLTQAALAPVVEMQKAIDKCPVCKGRGVLPVDEHGFKAECGHCGGMRAALREFRGK